jgi:hypothetical protein
MKHTVIIISFIFHCFVLYSQGNIIANYDSINSTEPEVDNYVYTYWGNIFTGRDFQISKEGGISYIAIDSFEVDLSLVKFIKYNSTFWANTNKIESDSKDVFSLQTHEGKLNLYTKVELRKNVTYNGIYLASNHIWVHYTTNIEKNVFEYYNQGFGDLKSVKYKNLVGDLSDNPSSMMLLRKSQTYKNSSALFYLVGVASLVYGFSTGFSSDESYNLKNASFYLPIGIGISSIWIGSIYSKKRTKSLRDAIMEY